MATLAGRDKEVVISAETIMALEAKYPTMIVGVELAKMHLWLLNNPSRRPVKVLRFVESWLKRAKPAGNVVTISRRDNLNLLCGRDNGSKFGTTGILDSTAIRPDARQLRIEDVGPLGGRSASGCD